MNQKNVADKPTSGYFVVIDEEEGKVLHNAMHIDTARLGIFYKKDELISTIKSNPCLKDKAMEVVEISVHPNAIINPNCTKFGIRGGMKIPIIKIHPFTEMIAATA